MAQKEGEVEIVGGNNADDGSNTNIVNTNIVGRQYSDHPQHQPLVAALSTKKYTPLQKKRELVLLFLPSKLDDVERYWRDPDLYNHFFRHLLYDLRRNTLNNSQINKNLTQAYTSVMIADLFVLNEWNSQLVDGRRLSRQDPSTMVKKAFKEVSELVGPVLVAYDIDQKKIQQKKNRSKVNLQATGTRVQDTKPLDPKNMDPDACPSCNHWYCMPVTTVEEVKAKQKIQDEEYKKKLSEWEKTGNGNRSKNKPRNTKSVAVEVACYCCRNHCNLRPDGGSCIACMDVQGAMLVYSDDGRVLKCTCDICNCKCQVKFAVNDRKNIQLEMQRKKRATEGSSSSTPTDTTSFFASVIQETIQQSTIDAMQDPSSNDPTMVHQNSMSLAAGSVLANPAMQSVQLRNNMQKAVPCTTMTSTGYSMSQLRKRQQAGLVTPSNANQSALAMTGIEREQRFISNRLSAQPIVPPTVAARPTHSISTLDDDSDEIQILEPKKEDDRKPKAVELKSSTPQIIKRGRKRINKMLNVELRKKKEDKDEEKIREIKKAKEGLSSEKLTKDMTEFFVDNEPDYEDSQEVADVAIGLFN